MWRKRANLPAEPISTTLAAEAHNDDDNDDIITTKDSFSCLVCGMKFDNVDFDKVQLHYRVSHIRSNKLWNDKDEEGVIAFGEWLTSRGNNDIGHKRLSLIKFQEDVQVLILDKELGDEVNVDILKGVLQCRTCCTGSDCIHVGFSTCISQIYRRKKYND